MSRAWEKVRWRLVDRPQHHVDIRVVQHKEAFGIVDDVDVLLQHRHAEGVKGADIPGVRVGGQGPDALLHLAGGFIGKGHAEDVLRQDADLVDQIGVPVGQGPGLAGAGSSNDADIAFGGGDGLPLGSVESLEDL